MPRGWNVIGLFAAACVAFAPGSLAAATVEVSLAPQAAAMATGSMTSQPIGHYEFCKSHASECQAHPADLRAPRVTAHGWDVVREVNAAVNFSVMPKTDEELYGKEEVWAYPKTAGDCEDYVLLKRYMLMQRGFDASDLLITVVRKPDGEGHAVLTLRTSDGDYILDNLVDGVKRWTDTPYTYLKRQSIGNSGRWVTIDNSGEVLVGSVR